MSDIVRRFEMMNRIGERPMGDEERRIALALSRDLQGWMGESPLGQFVDRPSTVDLRAKVLSFETKNIAESGGLQKVGMMILANLLMRWMMRDKSQRKRVVVEELKALTDTPQAIRTTVSLFATAAKYNTAMTVLNQGASIFADPALNSVLNNASIFLLFRLDREEANIIGERLMLPDTVVNELPRLKKVDGLYSEVMAIIRRSDGVLEGGVLRLQASPLEYWHYTSGKDDRGPREEAIVRHGGNRRAALLELASDWKVVL